MRKRIPGRDGVYTKIFRNLRDAVFRRRWRPLPWELLTLCSLLRLDRYGSWQGGILWYLFVWPLQNGQNLPSVLWCGPRKRKRLTRRWVYERWCSCRSPQCCLEGFDEGVRWDRDKRLYIRVFWRRGSYGIGWEQRQRVMSTLLILRWDKWSRILCGHWLNCPTISLGWEGWVVPSCYSSWSRMYRPLHEAGWTRWQNYKSVIPFSLTYILRLPTH